MSYLVDVLALKLRQQLAQALGVDLDSDGLDDLLNVIGGGLVVAAESEEEVGCEVLHFERFCMRSLVRILRFSLPFARAALWRREGGQEEEGYILLRSERGRTHYFVYVKRHEISIDLTGLPETESSSPEVDW